MWQRHRDGSTALELQVELQYEEVPLAVPVMPNVVEGTTGALARAGRARPRPLTSSSVTAYYYMPVRPVVQSSNHGPPDRHRDGDGRHFKFNFA